MKQRIEIIIGASIDCDTWIPEQEKNEKIFKRKITSFVASMIQELQVEKSVVDYVEIEYGDPV